MTNNGQHTSLLDSPTNLKEAIDWILRVTNKDGQGPTPSATDCLCPLSQAVVTVLRDVRVKEYLDHQEEKALVSEILSSIETIGGVRTTRKLIEEVAEGLRKFVGWKKEEESSDKGKITSPNTNGIGCPGKNGGSGCSHNKTGGSNCQGYQSSYSNSATISELMKKKDSTQDSWTILAKIFLGCIPFIFSGLSFMYWACSADGSGGREGFKNGDTVNNESQVICHYLKRMGYETSQLRTGSTKGSEAKGITVKELKDAIKNSGILTNGAEAKLSDSFAMYLEKVRDEVRKKVSPTPPTTGGGKTTEHALLKLNILCTGYFRALNQPYRVHRRNHRLPRTIREILYWLSCVQYCPVFRVLVQKMQQLCRRNGEGPNGEITFYGSNYKGEQTTCKIDSSNCITYFLSAALVAPMVLLSIQDTIESRVGNVKPSSGKKTPEKPTHEMTYQEKIDWLADNSTPVPIHDLYSNSLFEFRFPMSETESYYLLQDCLFGLFYQLYFLMKQCFWGRKSEYGWQYCKYGDGVKCDKCVSWICPVGKMEDHDYGKGKNGSNNPCGQPGKASPLQAFLCDCLKGFTCPVLVDGTSGKEKYKENLKELREGKEKDIETYTGAYPEFLEHRGHTDVLGQECAVPMGFTGCFRSGNTTESGSSSGTAAAGPSMIGLGICGVLYNFTIDDISSSSLYQLTRCICSLTRRVPRSTGTLYGFFYGLGGMLSDSSSLSNQEQGQKTDGEQTKKDFTRVLDKELLSCPGSRNIGGLIVAVYDWRGLTHEEINSQTKTKNNGYHEHGTLDSLNACKTDKVTCGWYLQPLSGCMYNSVATVYCDTYLSWILYLTKTLQDGLKALRDAFLGISCEDCKCEKGTNCQSSGCKKGSHGNPGTSGSQGCCCNSVVDCVGVHGLFYRFGFTYNSPGFLAQVGNDVHGKNYKRTCPQFYKHLDSVIKGRYYTQLTKEIYRFLYSTRALFGVYIGVYWLAVMGYLLWSITGPLDLLHIQSHWRSPRSYLVPLQRILADGSRNVKRVCTMKYFGDGTGKGLLEQGINDVYL